MELSRKYGGKLEVVLVMNNICWNFEKKLVEYSEKRHGNFRNLGEYLLETRVNFE